MVGTVIQKKALAKTMAKYFSEKGYLGTPGEFNQDPGRPEGIKLFNVQNIFGAWSTMLQYTKQFPETAEIMKEIPLEKPAPVVVPKKPAKTTKKVDKEGADGKDI